MAPVEHSWDATQSPATQRADIEGQSRERQSCVDSRTVRGPSKESSLLDLSLTDGPAGVCAGKFRRDRAVAHDGGWSRSRRVWCPQWQAVRGAIRAARVPVEPSRTVC